MKERCGATHREVAKYWGSGYCVYTCKKPKGHMKREHRDGNFRWREERK